MSRDRRIRGLQAASWAAQAADRRLTPWQTSALWIAAYAREAALTRLAGELPPAEAAAIPAWVAEHAARADAIHKDFWAREIEIRSSTSGR